MKKLLMTTLIVALATCVGLAQYASEKTQMAGKTDPAITKIAKDWEAAFNAKDIAKVASFYTEDAVLMPPNEPMVRGRANIEAFFRKEIAKMGTPQVILTPTESSISGSTAYEIGIYQLSIKPATGQPSTDKGKYVVILKRGADGQWRLANDIFNSDLPPPPPPKT